MSGKNLIKLTKIRLGDEYLVRRTLIQYVILKLMFQLTNGFGKRKRNFKQSLNGFPECSFWIYRVYNLFADEIEKCLM